MPRTGGGRQLIGTHFVTEYPLVHEHCEVTRSYGAVTGYLEIMLGQYLEIMLGQYLEIMLGQ